MRLELVSENGCAESSAVTSGAKAQALLGLSATAEAVPFHDPFWKATKPLEGVPFHENHLEGHKDIYAVAKTVLEFSPNIIRGHPMTEPTYEELKARLATLEKNRRTRSAAERWNSAWGEKGGVSVYGLGRFSGDAFTTSSGTGCWMRPRT